MICDEALCEARVQVDFVQPIGLVPQTIIVEGNRNGPACEGTAKLGNAAPAESVR